MIFYNAEQLALQELVKKLVADAIIPKEVTWKKEKIFPAHKVFKIFGDSRPIGIQACPIWWRMA
jgi:hypothetical protein